MGTALIESKLTYLHQIKGPALGLYQVERRTLDDLYATYLVRKERFSIAMDEMLGHMEAEQAVTVNLVYASAVARLLYWRSPMPLPAKDDVEGMAHFWKACYNTTLGKGVEGEFVRHYNKYVKENN